MDPPAELVADYWRDRARGVLLGAACGDALAATSPHRSTLGGHVPSTAALTGSLAGARVGAAGVPDHLRERPTARDELTRVADRLARRKTEQAV